MTFHNQAPSPDSNYAYLANRFGIELLPPLQSPIEAAQAVDDIATPPHVFDNASDPNAEDNEQKDTDALAQASALLTYAMRVAESLNSQGIYGEDARRFAFRAPNGRTYVQEHHQYRGMSPGDLRDTLDIDAALPESLQGSRHGSYDCVLTCLDDGTSVEYSSATPYLIQIPAVREKLAVYDPQYLEEIMEVAGVADKSRTDDPVVALVTNKGASVTISTKDQLKRLANLATLMGEGGLLDEDFSIEVHDTPTLLYVLGQFARTKDNAERILPKIHIQEFAASEEVLTASEIDLLRALPAVAPSLCPLVLNKIDSIRLTQNAKDKFEGYNKCPDSVADALKSAVAERQAQRQTSGIHKALGRFLLGKQTRHDSSELNTNEYYTALLRKIDLTDPDTLMDVATGLANVGTYRSNMSNVELQRTINAILPSFQPSLIQYLSSRPENDKFWNRLNLFQFQQLRNAPEKLSLVDLLTIAYGVENPHSSPHKFYKNKRHW